MNQRDEVIKLARSWIGLKESDGSYKKLIDIYNGYKGKLPRGLKMQYNWSWCACTWSALAIKLGYTDIMPIEISCGELINQAKKMNVWKEDDSYIPSPGDAVLYDWDDNGKGDCVGWPDHVGVVERVSKSSGYFVVIEGNYGNTVKRRTVNIDGKGIRGFITPKYKGNVDVSSPELEKDIKKVALEVISGSWGDGKEREEFLGKAGYDYKEVQKVVNAILNGDLKAEPENADQNQPIEKRVMTSVVPKEHSNETKGIYTTTANLYCRNGAGTNKKALCLIPKGTKVKSFGFYTTVSKKKWIVVEVIIKGTLYQGYCHEDYLK